MTTGRPLQGPFADPIRKHLETARRQISQGQLKQAAQTLNQAQRILPGDARLFMLAALMAEKSGNQAGAFDAMRRCLNVAPNWGPGLLESALLHARHDQFPQAIELAEKVAKLEPHNLQVLAGVIDIAHRSGHTEMAVRHLRRGLELVPGDMELRRMLAQDLSALGQHEEALTLWNDLVAENPGNQYALEGRLQALTAANQINSPQAQEDAAALLALQPDNPIYAYQHQLTQGQTPDQQPIEISRDLFDGMAEGYDLHMVGQLGYRLPKLVAEKITQRHPQKDINVLDLGCGTGLLGVYLGRLNGHLIGVDVAHKMIEQAARHQVYDRFHMVNLHDALQATPDGLYHVLTALDVFIYAGDLTAALPNAQRILLPGGVLYFSCEIAPEDGPDLILQANGRYAHKRSHIEALCAQAGLETTVEELILRQEAGQPVSGLLVTAYKPEAGTDQT